MKVSLLIPVYKVEKHIEKCLRSIFNQTYDNIEYIFVDDKTPDNSINLIKQISEEYPSRKPMIKIIHHEANRGLSAARNTAIKHATGEYIMHVDSDDYLNCDAVEKTIKKAQKDHADIVLFDANYIFLTKTTVSYANVPNDKIEYIHRIIRRDCSANIWGGLYRRTLYTDHNIWAIEGINYGEDYVTKPRLIYYAKKISYLHEALYNYVQYNTNSYTQNISKKSIDDILNACKILSIFFKNINDKSINYEKIDTELKIRNKVFLLEYCNKTDRAKINNLFPEISKEQISMPIKHKIVWFLSRHRMKTFLNIYLTLGTMIKKKFNI